MKTKLFLPLMFFMCITIFAQKNDEIETQVITINLSDPSKLPATPSVKSNLSNKRLSIKSKDLLIFKLEGGNPFKYKYVINEKLINFFEEKNNNPINNVEKILNKESTNNIASNGNNNEEISEKIDEIEKSKAKPTIKKDRNNKSYKVSLTPEQLEKNKEKDEKIKELKKYISKSKNSIKILQKTEEAKDEKEDKKNITEALHYIKNKAVNLEYYVNQFILTSKSEDEINIDNFKKDRLFFNEQYISLLKDYNGIKIDASTIGTIDEQYDSFNEDFKKTMISISENINEMFSLKTTYYTLPIDINGKNIDAVEITVKRFDSKDPIPLNERKYNIWVTGGLKIDVSGGVYLSSLVNMEYYIKDSPTAVGQKVILEKQQGNFDFGFGSSINISHRSAGWANPTLNVGAMFTTNQQFQLLAGLGLILGKEERIIFSGGLSMGRINKIAESYKADGTTSYDLGIGAVPTTSVFAFGYYFGITYNFSKVKKQNSSNPN